jgi:hypothetical protein
MPVANCGQQMAATVHNNSRKECRQYPNPYPRLRPRRGDSAHVELTEPKRRKSKCRWLARQRPSGEWTCENKILSERLPNRKRVHG